MASDMNNAKPCVVCREISGHEPRGMHAETIMHAHSVNLHVLHERETNASTHTHSHTLTHTHTHTCRLVGDHGRQHGARATQLLQQREH
jgi:hypothetical protein